MPTPSVAIRCDGCGLPAGSEHLAERLQRLELATRYRPVHINILFVAFAPAAQHDFYSSPAGDSFSQGLMAGFEIAAPPAGAAAAQTTDASAPLLEFQRRGYYLCYVSECALPPESYLLQGAAALARLAPSLVLRIQRNYKPHKIALLGLELRPLIAVLRTAGVGPLVLAPGGQPLLLPDPSDAAALVEFRASIAAQ